MMGNGSNTHNRRCKVTKIQKYSDNLRYIEVLKILFVPYQNKILFSRVESEQSSLFSPKATRIREGREFSHKAPPPP